MIQVGEQRLAGIILPNKGNHRNRFFSDKSNKCFQSGWAPIEVLHPHWEKHPSGKMAPSDSELLLFVSLILLSRQRRNESSFLVLHYTAARGGEVQGRNAESLQSLSPPAG